MAARIPASASQALDILTAFSAVSARSLAYTQ